MARQSSSVCHVTGPDHCKQTAAEILSEQGEPRLKLNQKITDLYRGPKHEGIG